MQEDSYFTIEKGSVAEFKDRGSRFIAYSHGIQSVTDVKQRLEQIKKEHPRATHHCYAYRLGLDNNNFRVSDDGEPSGTAGRPILGQIDSRELTDVLIIVVRYFGGTLLGVPGLINAYKSCASLVIQVSTIIQKPIEAVYELQFDYTQVNAVMGIIKLLNCSVIENEMQLFCRITIGVPIAKRDEFLYRLQEIRNIEVGKR